MAIARAQSLPLGGLEEVVGPVDGRLQGALAGQGGLGGSGEDPERRLESVGEALAAQELEPLDDRALAWIFTAYVLASVVGTPLISTVAERSGLSFRGRARSSECPVRCWSVS